MGEGKTHLNSIKVGWRLWVQLASGASTERASGPPAARGRQREKVAGSGRHEARRQSCHVAEGMAVRERGRGGPGLAADGRAWHAAEGPIA